MLPEVVHVYILFPPVFTKVYAGYEPDAVDVSTEFHYQTIQN